MKIVGNLICQNGVHEVLRCIESVAPIVDDFYVMDGGSTDGTLDVLQRYKDVYNLTVFEHPFEQMDKQRNELLKHAPKGSWVISIDQDEKLNYMAMCQMREFIDLVSKKLYSDPKRESPLTIGIPFLNFVKDLNHHTPSWMGRVNEKIFYNDRTVHFTRWYHSYLIYKEGDTTTSMLLAPQGWAILHYAFLDKKRIEDAPKEIREGKRDYKPREWDMSKRPASPLLITMH